MDHEHFHEARRLAERAEALLHADEPASLFRLPAFRDWESMSLALSTEQAEVVYRTWRMRLDHDKLRSPVERLRWPKVLKPTIEERRSGIDVADARLLYAKLKTLTARPLPRPETVVLEGCRFRMLTRHTSTSCSVEWIGQPPAACLLVATTFSQVWQQLALQFDPSVRPDFNERER